MFAAAQLADLVTRDAAVSRAKRKQTNVAASMEHGATSAARSPVGRFAGPGASPRRLFVRAHVLSRSPGHSVTYLFLCNRHSVVFAHRERHALVGCVSSEQMTVWLRATPGSGPRPRSLRAEPQALHLESHLVTDVTVRDGRFRLSF